MRRGLRMDGVARDLVCTYEKQKCLSGWKASSP